MRENGKMEKSVERVGKEDAIHKEKNKEEEQKGVVERRRKTGSQESQRGRWKPRREKRQGSGETEPSLASLASSWAGSNWPTMYRAPPPHTSIEPPGAGIQFNET